MAKTRNTGLGRGLDSLFGDSIVSFEPVSVIAPEKADTQEEKIEKSESKAPAKSSAKKTAAKTDAVESVVYIALGDIKPNSKQPRSVFDEDALNELAASIKEHGVIQPVLVRPAAKGYELVAGERRWRAARKAGLKEVPAIVRELDERQNSFYALIENMQRENLNSIEEARAIRNLMDSYSLSQDEAALSVGKSRPYVANALRLLKLPEEVQKLVEDKKLSAGHARAIAGLSGKQLQLEAAEKAVKGNWSVRQIENYTGQKKERKPRKTSKKAENPELSAVLEKLSISFGTKVKLNGTESKGLLEFEYYSREELERLVEVLLAEK